MKQYSKYRSTKKGDEVGRPGRLNRGERWFLRNPEHTGKGKTLRDHRG